MEKGTQNGTITDFDGKFILEVSDNATLQFSYIGFMPTTVAIAGQTSLNVRLKEDTQALEEVVVVGYGTQKKVNLTGSVSSVKFDGNWRTVRSLMLLKHFPERFPACGSARIRVSREMMERN